MAVALAEGDEVEYHGRDGVQAARILKVHHDDDPPYFTIQLQSGSERQTCASKLQRIRRAAAAAANDDAQGSSENGMAASFELFTQCTFPPFTDPLWDAAEGRAVIVLRSVAKGSTRSHSGGYTHGRVLSVSQHSVELQVAEGSVKKYRRSKPNKTKVGLVPAPDAIVVLSLSDSDSTSEQQPTQPAVVVLDDDEPVAQHDRSWRCKSCMADNTRDVVLCTVCTACSPDHWQCAACSLVNGVGCDACSLCSAPSAKRRKLDETASEQPIGHKIYVDLDNWGGFFRRLRGPLPRGTHVDGFFGGKTKWTAPRDEPSFVQLCSAGGWRLHPACVNRKDAADFALAMQVGTDDATLPKSVPFTILSGDGGFEQLTRSGRATGRQVHVVNPHGTEADLVFATLLSIGEQ